jgi:hypothetical protein
LSLAMATGGRSGRLGWLMPWCPGLPGSSEAALSVRFVGIRQGEDAVPIAVGYTRVDPGSGTQ